MIAYSFPPRGGSGVQRTVKFAKYLPEFGWEPIILTVSNPPLDEPDYSLLDEVPKNIQVFRTRSFEPHRHFNSKLEGQISSKDMYSESARPNMEHFFGRVKSFLSTWLLIPDRWIGWFPSAFLQGIRILRNNKIDLIYSTSPPLTDHLVAYLVKRLSGKPWIADFRDPWTQFWQYERSSYIRSRIDEAFEKIFLDSANKVIVTCYPTAKGLLEKYTNLDMKNFIEITNGFDPNDFKDYEENRSPKFVITYTGRFHSKQSFSPCFLKALYDLAVENPGFKEDVEVIFTGLFGQDASNLLKEFQLDDIVRCIGYLPHRNSIRYLLQSDVLLITLNTVLGHDKIYPGKLFEYLAAKKPILALVAEGPTADLIRKMNAGIVVSPDDIEEIKVAVRELYDRFIQGKMHSNTYSDLYRFKRRHLTKSLAEQMDKLVGALGARSSV